MRHWRECPGIYRVVRIATYQKQGIYDIVASRNIESLSIYREETALGKTRAIIPEPLVFILMRERIRIPMMTTCEINRGAKVVI
jgi:hypothetical protein